MNTIKLKCHPKIKTKKLCLTKQILYLKKLWNKRHPDKKIQTNNINKIKIKLKYYNSLCNNELCIKKIINKKIRNDIFAPFTPKTWKLDKNTWLNSLDIINVMKQYEETYKDFIFIGPSPIDFDSTYNNRCVWDDLCNFNINTNKKYIGFIFNLDPHYKKGSHWVCMYIDLYEKNILYFDSNGTKIPNEIKILKDRIMKEYKGKLKYYDNYGLKHQKTNTECGMYCLYTIISLLTKKKKIDYFIKKKKDNKKVKKYREIYFNNI